MNNNDTNQLATEVLKKFRIIFGTVRQHYSEVEQTCGVSGSQMWLMHEIVKAPGIGVSELAKRLSIHQSTCSQLVEKLVSRNLLIKERSKEDQRRVGLQLTEEALGLIAKSPGPADGVLPEALRTLSTEAILGLSTSLQELILKLQVSDDKLGERPLSEL